MINKTFNGPCLCGTCLKKQVSMQLDKFSITSRTTHNLGLTPNRRLNKLRKDHKFIYNGLQRKIQAEAFCEGDSIGTMKLKQEKALGFAKLGDTTNKTHAETKVNGTNLNLKNVNELCDSSKKMYDFLKRVYSDIILRKGEIKYSVREQHLIAHVSNFRID